jgi:hypothetical protein
MLALQFLQYAADDGAGRLEFTRIAAQAHFSHSMHSGELFFVGKTEFEASPLSRPLKALAPATAG